MDPTILAFEKAQVFSCDEQGRPDWKQHFSVQFNPSSISITEPIGDDAAASATPDKAPRRRLFGNKPSLHFSAKLFFNTILGLDLSTGDVRDQLRKFYYFFNDQAHAAAGTGDRKLICFAWSTIQVYGFLAGMQVSYTMFAPNGTPVRAEADIAIDGRYCGNNGDYLREGPGDEAARAAQTARDVLERAQRTANGAAGWRDVALELDLANPRLMTTCGTKG